MSYSYSDAIIHNMSMLIQSIDCSMLWIIHHCYQIELQKSSNIPESVLCYPWLKQTIEDIISSISDDEKRIHYMSKLQVTETRISIDSLKCIYDLCIEVSKEQLTSFELSKSNESSELNDLSTDNLSIYTNMLFYSYSTVDKLNKFNESVEIQEDERLYVILLEILNHLTNIVDVITDKSILFTSLAYSCMELGYSSFGSKHIMYHSPVVIPSSNARYDSLERAILSESEHLKKVITKFNDFLKRGIAKNLPSWTTLSLSKLIAGMALANSEKYRIPLELSTKPFVLKANGLLSMDSKLIV